MSNKFVSVAAENLVEKLSVELRHCHASPVAEPDMDDVLAGFILGVLSEDGVKDAVAHSLSCPACLAKLYQLNAALKSIKRYATTLNEGGEYHRKFDLIAELDRIEEEDVPDIPLELSAPYGSNVNAHPHAPAETPTAVSAGAEERPDLDTESPEMNRSADFRCLAAAAAVCAGGGIAGADWLAYHERGDRREAKRTSLVRARFIGQ